MKNNKALQIIEKGQTKSLTKTIFTENLLTNDNLLEVVGGDICIKNWVLNCMVLEGHCGVYHGDDGWCVPLHIG